MRVPTLRTLNEALSSGVQVWRAWRIFWKFGGDFQEFVGNKAICLLRSTVSVLLLTNIIDEYKFNRTTEMIHFQALNTQRRPWRCQHPHILAARLWRLNPLAPCQGRDKGEILDSVLMATLLEGPMLAHATTLCQGEEPKPTLALTPVKHAKPPWRIRST